jgi:hypothetical protein
MSHKVLNLCVKRNATKWTGFKSNCPKSYNQNPFSCKENKKIIINVNVKNEQKGNYETQESIPPAGPSNRDVVPARQAGNRFLGSLKGLQILAQG